MESGLEAELLDPATALDQAIQHHRDGRAEAAAAAYQAILEQDAQNADAWHLLGMLACDRGDPRTAMHLIDTAIGLEADRAAFHNTRARALTLCNALAEAEAAYSVAWKLRPDTPEIANNLGCLLRDRGDLDGAEQWLVRAAALAPHIGEVAGNLADLLANKGAEAASLVQFRRAVRQSPGSAEIHRKFARLLFSLGRLTEAEEHYHAALRVRSDHAATHNDLGLVLQAQGRDQAAMQCFRAAIRHDPGCADAHYNLGSLLLLDNAIAAARACQDRAIAAAPLHGAALWARCMVELPVMYTSAQEIMLQRARYARQLDGLVARADDPAVARALAAAVGASQPFFLPYQGECDRTLQTTYGELAARVVQGLTPPLATPARLITGQRLRVGIVSGFFYEHTIWRLMLRGWLSELDRARFDVHAYHTSAMEDGQTELARGLVQRFVGGRGVDIRAAIRHDQPHVLLYPELGIDPVAARLGAERLAPVQCVSWGQPETSGSPVMDCFLSSALMEPRDAASHYSERLITLPNLGIHYAADERCAEPCSRAALGLRPNAMVFWCGQALYKYLPQFDDVFARIAAGVSDCQFLFIGFARSHAVTAAFRSRLQLAFAARDLDAERYCVFVAPMSQERFLGTVRLADIVLDSIGWSGGKSTLDALAEAPVIVTHAGPLMRGRHTAAILTCIGVTETIAATIDDYVAISVRLAGAPAERAALRERVRAGRHRAIADAAPIRALESVLADAVART